MACCRGRSYPAQRRASYAVLICLITSGCGSNPVEPSDTGEPTDTTTPSFSIAVTPATQSVARGESATFTVTVQGTSGLTGSVGLFAIGIPGNQPLAGTGFNPQSVSPGNATATASFTVATDASTPAGTVDVLIEGRNGTLTQSVSVSLSVTAISAPPPPEPPPSASTPPSVTSAVVNGVGTAAATLSAMVNPNGLATNAHFEWGLTTSYGNATASQSLGSGATAIATQVVLDGLTPNTTYHARLTATNSAGTAQGPAMTFTTMANAPPTDVTLSVTPTTGTQLTTFTVTGSNYTTNGTIHRFVRIPGGNWQQISPITASPSGTITTQWPFQPGCSYPVGIAYAYAVDAETGRTSPTISENISADSSCQADASLLTLTPNPLPGINAVQEMTLIGTGFGANLRVFYRNRFEQVELNPADVTVVNAGQARVRVNLGTTAASWYVSVQNGSGTRSGEIVFRVVSNDYPANWITPSTVRPCDDNVPPGDSYGFFRSNCTSFVAWRLAGDGKPVTNVHGVSYTCISADPHTNGRSFTRWTDASCWDESARALGKRVDDSPEVGAIAQWNTAGNGHVAYVAAVYLDRQVVKLEEYNLRNACRYDSTREVLISSVDNFIHF